MDSHLSRGPKQAVAFWKPSVKTKGGDCTSCHSDPNKTQAFKLEHLSQALSTFCSKLTSHGSHHACVKLMEQAALELCLAAKKATNCVV